MINSLSSTKQKAGSGFSQKENSYEAGIELTKKLSGIRGPDSDNCKTAAGNYQQVVSVETKR